MNQALMPKERQQMVLTSSMCLDSPDPQQGGTLSLKQPPKWLCHPANNLFSFRGKLVMVLNLPSVQGKN
jgi:hypothetical protein